MDQCSEFGHHCGRCDARHIFEVGEAIEDVRQTLRARLEGRNEGGDTEVMRLVDEIVEKEKEVIHITCRKFCCRRPGDED